MIAPIRCRTEYTIPVLGMLKLQSGHSFRMKSQLGQANGVSHPLPCLK